MIGHNSQIGEGCNLQNVVVDHDAIVPAAMRKMAVCSRRQIEHLPSCRRV